jgi:response regulator RpfG family c-di-GMP phosphodiesterase
VNKTDIHRALILIVDDQETNVTLLRHLLEAADFRNLVSTTDSRQAVPLCAELEPDIVLLDLRMPEPDGFEVLKMLGPWINGSARLPVVVLTADNSSQAKREALSVGASDFLTKPFDMSEVVLRISNHLLTRQLQLQLRDQNRTLEDRVRERTRELEEAREELVERLALAAEYREDASGEHPQRVGRLAALLARELGLDEETVELIRRAAPLHDVGNIGVPDTVFVKRRGLTPLELEAIKLHVSIGSEILGRSRSRLLRIAEEIARTHHERWDGTGYLERLRGEDIPLSGRIVAVADAFDMLTDTRSSRESVSQDAALGEIRNLSGRKFDPRVVEALASLESNAVAGEPAAVVQEWR